MAAKLVSMFCHSRMGPPNVQHVSRKVCKLEEEAAICHLKI